MLSNGFLMIVPYCNEIIVLLQSDKKEKQAYIEELKSCLNPKNLSKYLFSFCKRSDLSAIIGTKLDKSV